jgi:hypothetical protein
MFPLIPILGTRCIGMVNFTHPPLPLYYRETTPVPFSQKAEWIPEPVWKLFVAMPIALIRPLSWITVH